MTLPACGHAACPLVAAPRDDDTKPGTVLIRTCRLEETSR